MPAEKCIELLQCKLKEFGLSLSEDIVAICTDGASVMCKVGKLIEAEQQLCLAHGIQLAVLDVFYRHKYNTQCGQQSEYCQQVHSDVGEKTKSGREEVKTENAQFQQSTIENNEDEEEEEDVEDCERSSDIIILLRR